MNTLNIGLALQITYDLLRHASQVSALIGKAVTEGRDLTDEEVGSIATSDDVARARLQSAIDAVDPPAPPVDP